MPERKWKLRISEDFFHKGSNQASVKEGLGVSLCNRADIVNNDKKTEKKWNMDIKDFKKQTQYDI